MTKTIMITLAQSQCLAVTREEEEREKRMIFTSLRLNKELENSKLN